jgi:hypothetical protein
VIFTKVHSEFKITELLNRRIFHSSCFRMLSLSLSKSLLLYDHSLCELGVQLNTIFRDWNLGFVVKLNGDTRV